MKNWKMLFLVIIAAVYLAGCTAEIGQIIGGVAGAALDGALAGATDTEPGTGFSDLGALIGRVAGLENEMREAKVDLSAIPANWRDPKTGKPTGQFDKDDQGRYCYYLNEDCLIWDPALKKWIPWDEIGQPAASAASQASTPAAAPPPKQVAMRPPDKKAAVKVIPMPAEKTFDSGATLADARKAKQAQKLKGRMFQSSSRAWYLEDTDGKMWIFRGGVFCELPRK